MYRCQIQTTANFRKIHQTENPIRGQLKEIFRCAWNLLLVCKSRVEVLTIEKFRQEIGAVLPYYCRGDHGINKCHNYVVTTLKNESENPLMDRLLPVKGVLIDINSQDTCENRDRRDCHQHAPWTECLDHKEWLREQPKCKYQRCWIDKKCNSQ